MAATSMQRIAPRSISPQSSATNPGLIHLEASWFGGHGPYADFTRPIDHSCVDRIGQTGRTGRGTADPRAGFPDRHLRRPVGIYAVASSALGRMQDGRGRSSRLSIFESSIAVTEYIMFESFLRGDIMRRIGVNRFWPTFPVGIHQTKQGWLGVTTVTPAQWRGFCDMLGLPELRDDAGLLLGVDRLAAYEEIEAQNHSAVEAAHRAGMVCGRVRRKIPIVPVPEIADLMATRRSERAARLCRS